MAQKKKLDLKELELQLPSIDSNETKIILGGNDYGGGNGQFDMWYWGPSTGVDAAHDNYQDQGDLDHYYDVDGDGVEDNAGADEEHEIGPNDAMDWHNDHTGKDYIVDFYDLPDVEQQPPNYCSAFAMEYINEFFTGENSDMYNDISDYYHEISNEWMYANGLDSEYVDEVLEHFFFTDEIDGLDDIIAALDEGHPVFATLDFGDPDPTDSDPTHDGHAVVIVGYDYDNDLFIYADPQTGEYGTTDGSNVLFDYSFEITGVRP